MARTLEAIFRRPIRLLTLILLLPLVGLAVAYALPRSYQATATLWALRSYQTLSLVGSTNNYTTNTPADTQATALSELLHSRAFALTVAHQVPDFEATLDLSSNVQANPQLRDDALFTEISAHVQVQSQGYSLFVISYKNRNPQVAQQVVADIISNYGIQSENFLAGQAANLLAADQQQLTTAMQDVQTAVQAETHYVATHPKGALVTDSDYLLILQRDPQYVLLHAQTQEAELQLQNIQTQIATVQQESSSQGTGTETLFKVLDAPIVPAQPVPRASVLLIGAGSGLGASLAACMLYILILVRRDSAVYTAFDLQKVTSLPVVMQLPHLKSKTAILVRYTVNQTSL